MNTIEQINQIADEAISAIEKIRKETTTLPNLNEPVVVAGIKWGGYLTPSEQCKEPAHYNEDTGLWYFSQRAAILHAYEQNLRLPTKEDYQHLYDNTTHEWTERNGRKGMLFTDSITGKSVFFPASGYRNYSNGSFYFVSTHGYYWSSSVYGATLGLNLYFYSSWVYPQLGYHRSRGFPVRCVSSVSE